MSAGCCSHDGIGPVRIPGFPGRGISGPVNTPEFPGRGISGPVNIPEFPGRGKLTGPKLLGGDGTGFDGCSIGGRFVKSVTSKTGAGGLECHNLRVLLSVRPVLEWTYEGWNFNSGNYLFTTDTK